MQSNNTSNTPAPNGAQTVIEIDGVPVEIKARREAFGIAVVAFTPACSLRSSRLHLASSREAFCRSIAFAVLDPLFEDDVPLLAGAVAAVERAVAQVTEKL